MKNLYKIYKTLGLLSLGLLGLVGCQSDINVDDTLANEGSVIITMEIYNDVTATKATTYAIQEGVLGGAEYVVDNLRIFVFSSDGTLETNDVFTSLAADHIIQQEIVVPKDISKEIYFVANEPAALTSKLNEITSSEELLEIDVNIANVLNDINKDISNGFNAAASFTSEDFLLPMTASYSVLNAMIDLDIYVGLTRAVARVDLYLDKDSSLSSREVTLDEDTEFTVDGVTYTSSLFPGTIGAASSDDLIEDLTVASSDITLGAVASNRSTAQRVLSFYVAERTYDSASEITIAIKGLEEDDVDIETSKSVTLGDGVDSSLTQITRNYIYQIFGTYYSDKQEIVTNEFKITDWTDVYIDAEIEGVMVAVDSEVAMDWLLNGNSYTSKTISFGSNKAISFYLPVSVSSDDDNVPDYEFALYEFADMSAGKSYDLKEIALSNSYIHATTWIESATIHFTSAQSGYFEFVYSPAMVNYKIQSYPIRIKSDNVIKQMKAVYDNGYLPASRLSDDWASRAPGGVIFAKRGFANHPLTTPEILYRDDDGYYRGEHSATAAEGTQYCIEQFGEDWYMPSTADIQEIAELYNMLGVSYRFQNNGSAENSGLLTASTYWTSTESSSSPGDYWSADFMSRVYMVDNLLTRYSGEQTHFVRCVMDLQ